MMGRSVVFGKVISAITFTRLPVNIELALVDAVSDPEEAHIHALRPLLFDCVCKDAHSTLSIHLDWCWRLWVAHFYQSRTNRHARVATVEHGRDFVLGSR